MQRFTDKEVQEMYNDMLDDVYGMIKIGPYEYNASKAMKDVDDIAWRCGFSDWIANELDEGNLYEHPMGGWCDTDPDEE